MEEQTEIELKQECYRTYGSCDAETFRCFCMIKNQKRVEIQKCKDLINRYNRGEVIYAPRV